jgi:SAM-dependent methyltransferase
VDLSPFVIRYLREAASRRVPAAQIESLVLDGAAYEAQPASFDLAVCLGASWTFGGHRQTLRTLAAAVKPGGKVLIGDPFWKHEPDPEYLVSEKVRRDEFDTHAANVEAGVDEGLVPWLALVSSDDERDRYESLQWRAVPLQATLERAGRGARPHEGSKGKLLRRAGPGRLLNSSLLATDMALPHLTRSREWLTAELLECTSCHQIVPRRSPVQLHCADCRKARKRTQSRESVARKRRTSR